MKKNNHILNIFPAFLFALCIVVMRVSIISFAAEDSENLKFNAVVEVESYSIEEGYIEAGKEANIVLSIHNTNKNIAINSLVATLSSESNMVYPTYGNDNQFVIGTLKANETTEITVPVIISQDFTGEFVDLSCKLVYEISGMQITNVSTMVLPAAGKPSIIVESIDVSSHATVNTKSLLSVRYKNDTNSNITDAVLVVGGKVTDSSKTIDLETVAAGKTYTKDFDIIYTQSGDQIVSILLRYTDLNGEVMEFDLGTFNVTVGEDNQVDNAADSSNANTVLVWFGRVIAALALASVAVVVALFIKKR